MTSKVIQGHKRRPFKLKLNFSFVLFVLLILIEETKAAENYERPRKHLPCTKTIFALDKDIIGKQ